MVSHNKHFHSQHTANRVVLFDSHFNPTIAEQACYRAFRYGQEKNVFCYRLLTEGTMEQKVYARSVNKSGVALRVIDAKSYERCFSKKELDDLQENLVWIQCDKCEKWRVLLGGLSEEDLPDEWDCSMNEKDPQNSNCRCPERPQRWYEERYGRLQSLVPIAADSPIKACLATRESLDGSSISEATKQEYVLRDEILQHLLQVRTKCCFVL
jgi:hypothetical protein